MSQASSKANDQDSNSNSQDYSLSSFEEAKLWDLPVVDDTAPDDENKTTAFNKPFTKWKYEAPEQEEEVTPLTAQDIEEIRQSAYQEGLSAGHEEGFAKGHEEGLIAGKEEGLALGKEEGLAQGKQAAEDAAREHIDALQSFVKRLEQPLKSIDEEVKNELVLLSVSLAKAVINTELSTSIDSLKMAIEQGIAALPINESVYQIHLHSQDKAQIEAHLTQNPSSESELASGASKWQLVANDEQGRGGCKIISQNNAVDMSISRRCENVFEPLLLNQGLANDPRAN
uniref:flagellar assembly protein FliH n=1 Tax=Ningiella ruwaisensis TaxID=2364274 RepID=UPI0010A05E00|nr:flagellar assembly protein FliH [Ningiella ruwaisensis]